jgi:hypothetical protein
LWFQVLQRNIYCFCDIVSDSIASHHLQAQRRMQCMQQLNELQTHAVHAALHQVVANGELVERKELLDRAALQSYMQLKLCCSSCRNDAGNTMETMESPIDALSCDLAGKCHVVLAAGAPEPAELLQSVVG